MIIWVAIFFYMILAVLVFTVLVIKQGDSSTVQLSKSIKVKRIILIYWFTAFLLSPLVIVKDSSLQSKDQLLDNLVMVIAWPIINYGILFVVGLLSTITARVFLVPLKETEETLGEEPKQIRLRMPTERDRTELLMMASSSVAIVIISILFFMLSHAPGGDIP